nr:beta-carotene 15,15'-monooxygenase [Lysinibacillus timonensis]
MSYSKTKINIWLILLCLVLVSNWALYKTSFGSMVVPDDPNPVVIGSLLDLIIIAPILFMLYKKKFSIKMAISLIAIGCICARMIIPMEFLKPFDAVTWVGIGSEAAIVLFELSLVISFARYLPKIKIAVRKSELPAVFSFPQAVDQYVTKNPIIYVICSEVLMFYYAFFSWKKKAREGMTIYKSSSVIAFQIMMIHAIVIETIGVHWLLHITGFPLVLSIIMLILNIYGVIFFLGDIQALRLNPVYFNHQAVFLSQGLMKRAEIHFDNIEEIVTDKEVLRKKLPKNTLSFVATDFTEVYPDVILKLKSPIKATLAMGIQREFSQVAIRSDEPDAFLEKIISATK